MPYLVMDTGYSVAPYNHIEFGQPMFIDYVWGRQIGELHHQPVTLDLTIIEVIPWAA